MTNNFQSTSASILLWMLTTAGASAQIIPDATLPDNTTATPNGNTIIINGGTRSGTNLFHSFREFNLGNGSTAFFNNSADIGNIISRVTGGNLSNIDGLIRANGSANLFLINPAGLVFGPNARLNIGGSFIGTTANSLIFDGGNFYSATNPNAPPLLTVNVPIGLQLSNPGEIQVTGRGNSGTFPDRGDGLAVSPGRTFALLGGDVTTNGGIVAAESGRIEIGSALRGEVSLTPVAVGWRLGYEGVGEFGEVRLSDRSSVWNSSLENSNRNSFPNSGIQIEGRRIVLEERSQIASVTEGSQPGGDILINATEALEIGGGIDGSAVVSQVEESATGSGGAIIVTAPQLRLFDGGRISSLSFGSGDGGSIAVNAAESILINGFAVGDGESFNSGIVSENYSAGSGGNIAVSTGELSLFDEGQILSFVSPSSTGNGGNINIFAAESVTATGSGNSDPFNPSSGIFSATRGRGRGGNISLSTARLSLFQTAFIGSETQGRGTGGDISVNVADLISISSSGRIASSAFGSSDGGAIAVSTQRLRLTDGGSIGTLVDILPVGELPPEAGTANAGNITVIVGDDLEAIGVNPEIPDNLSGVSSVTFANGKGGDVTIFARSLTVKDGATLSSAVIPVVSNMEEGRREAGSGSGGDLRVNVSELVVSGVNPFIAIPSNVGTLTFGDGNAGDTVINARRAIVENGGLISSFTSAGGDAGKITINATESILVTGSDRLFGFVAEVTADAVTLNEEVREAFVETPIATGNTGQLTINTNRLTVSNGGRINVQHEGRGNAGTLQINAAQVFLENGGSITAASASGRGGNITLNVPTSLQLRGGSRITAQAGGTGDGGNLSINAETIALLRNSNIDANAFEGNGGNIAITTNGLFSSPGSAITASSQLGVDGTVKIEQFGANPGEIIVDFAGDRLDAGALVTVSCEDYQNSEFIVTGRGGLPPNPTQQLTINTPLVEWAESQENLSAQYKPKTQYLREDTSSSSLVEATGWIVDGRGKIILVADAPIPTPTISGLIHPGCR